MQFAILAWSTDIVSKTIFCNNVIKKRVYLFYENWILKSDNISSSMQMEMH